ncbi:Antitoxin [Rhodococcus ruber]|uniref:antitoxin n=1 Tax=Rhodococcus ruber TaxID=1830 RepID=UPI00315D3295
MGFMDSVKGLVDKGKEFAAQNPDKIDDAIEKAGDLADRKTDGKYADQVDKVQDAARKALRAE